MREDHIKLAIGLIIVTIVAVLAGIAIPRVSAATVEPTIALEPACVNGDGWLYWTVTTTAETIDGSLASGESFQARKPTDPFLFGANGDGELTVWPTGWPGITATSQEPTTYCGDDPPEYPAEEDTGNTFPVTADDEVVVTGTASHMPKRFGPDYLALPEHKWGEPGIPVVISGPGGKIARISTDAGPDKAMQRAGRVADLSWWDFMKVCGVGPGEPDPGLCTVSIRYIGSIAAPRTDTE